MEVSIRPLSVSDITDEFVSWHQNADGHLDYYSGSRRSFSREDLISWVEGSEQRNTFFYLILVDGHDPVGTIKIGPIDISQANKVAFDEHDIRRLQGGMYENNIASIKAYCRADWVIEGRMKGYYWVDGAPMDRVCVACFNPNYFPQGADNEN